MVEAVDMADMPMSQMSEHRGESHKHDSTYGDDIQENSLANELRQMDASRQSPAKSVLEEEDLMPLNISEYLERHQVSQSSLF